jgi:hypothetical protein
MTTMKRIISISRDRQREEGKERKRKKKKKSTCEYLKENISVTQDVISLIYKETSAAPPPKNKK